MNVSIHKNTTKGHVQVPASKSCTQRALALSLLSETPVKLHRPDLSNDSTAALHIIQKLGTKIKNFDSGITVYPSHYQNLTHSNLSAGESGLAMRMFCSVAALFNHEITITGNGSLLKRPMQMIKQPLEDLGCKVELTNNHPPVTISGKLKGGKTKIDGSISSQFLTGLLIALPKAINNSILEVTNLKSKPYIDLTLEMVNQFGGKIFHDNYKYFKITGNQKYHIKNYHIERDWSSTSFHIVAAAISGRVELEGLNFQSKQADIKILKAVDMFGASITKDKNLIIEQNQNNAFTFNACDCPDLFPPLCVLASAANDICKIKGVQRLIHKESNRAEVLQKEFGKMGIHIELSGDWMTIFPAIPRGGVVHSHNDHRIAMAAALLGLRSKTPVTITEAEAVKKSYPDFFIDFEKITF